MKKDRQPKHSDKIFEDDEMTLMAVNSRWSPDELFAQEGVFFLKDVVKILPLDPVKVKKRARELETRNQSPWLIMGARKVWNHWIVRMTVFGPFYKKHFVSRVRSVESGWDGNVLLEQKGIFFLTEVCRIIPFSTHQLRYQAKRNPRSKSEYGIWKDAELNAFLVDMERFAPWIRGLWRGDFGRGGADAPT